VKGEKATFLNNEILYLPMKKKPGCKSAGFFIGSYEGYFFLGGGKGILFGEGIYKTFKIYKVFMGFPP